MNTYTIQHIGDFKFAITCGNTLISTHSTYEEADETRTQYYAGDSAAYDAQIAAKKVPSAFEQATILVLPTKDK